MQSFTYLMVLALMLDSAVLLTSLDLVVVYRCAECKCRYNEVYV